MPRPPVLPVIDWPAVFDAAGDFLRELPRRVNVLVIAEDWCGDVVRHVPALERLARETDRVLVRYVTREERPEIFVRYLTNGGEAIPRFVFLTDAWTECANWGPMPAVCRALIARGKACGDVPSARKMVAARYAADPLRTEAMTELLDLLELASCSEV